MPEGGKVLTNGAVRCSGFVPVMRGKVVQLVKDVKQRHILESWRGERAYN